ncbi:hypothetical protein [Haloarcula laminariae]|uniref:hypothetical protein n=1 Tax=Haloarcula laminariae TaxID=2961577 RepID=UPI0024067BAB|nr:hypothetical protein [Halomicroarcula sp. FL173]
MTEGRYDIDDPGVPSDEGESWQDVVDRRTHDWELGLGAVLYGPQPDSRDLWHVTKRLVDHDGDDHLYVLWDGTHTERRYVDESIVREDYTPAGWCWPVGEKPLYHLTRECGVDDPADLMTDGGEEPNETHVDPDRGLWIPPALREFDKQLVIRTPRATVQHFGSSPVDPYYGLVDESGFGAACEFRDPKNPDLAPDRVRIKPQGEEAVELVVDIHPEVRTDGGIDVPVCETDGCDTPCPGLEDGWEQSDGTLRCTDCWDEWEQTGQWPDEGGDR